MNIMTRTRVGLLAASVIAVVLLVAGLCGCSDRGAQVEAQAPEEQASYADSYYERLENCVKQIEAITDFKPGIVLVLGTGLGDYVDALDVKVTIPYAQIEGWPESTAPEHAGNLVLAERNGHKLAIMQSRLHYYEGYSMDEVVLPLRVLHMLGAAGMEEEGFTEESIEESMGGASQELAVLVDAMLDTL